MLWRQAPDSAWLFPGYSSKLKFIFLDWRIAPFKQTFGFFPRFLNWRERGADTEPGAPPVGIDPLRVGGWRCWWPRRPCGGRPGRGWFRGRERRAQGRGDWREDRVLAWAPLYLDCGRAALDRLGAVSALRGRRPGPPYSAGPKARALGKLFLIKTKEIFLFQKSYLRSRYLRFVK